MRFNKQLFAPIFVVLIVGTSACTNKTLINVSEIIEGENWRMDDTLQVAFQVTDTTRHHNIYLQSRLTPDFPYSNLYVKWILLDPDGVKTEAIKGFEITTKAGKWLGSGLGDLHSYSLQLIPSYVAHKRGTYTLKVVQYMRSDDLIGYHDRGLRVELGEEVF